jgi:putative heme-binding domain-containing protein
MKLAFWLLLISLAVCRGQAPTHVLETRDVKTDNQPEQNPYTSETDLAIGQQLFARRCALCHGAHGEGGRGRNLTTGEYRFGGSDRQLYRVLRNGIPDSDMPGSSSKPIDLWRLVEVVKRLGAAGVTEKAGGDASAGKAVYEKSGCAQCHLLNGAGSDLGPDLSAVGRQRSLAYLRESIVDPGADVPLAYRSVSVITPEGGKITGIHLNEDDYSIQLRDMSGNPRSLLKKELKEVRHEAGSIMPSYRSMPPADLDNLIAYLKAEK